MPSAKPAKRKDRHAAINLAMAAGHIGARQIKDQPNRRCGNRAKAGGKGWAVNGLAKGLYFNLKFPFSGLYLDLVKRVLDIASNIFISSKLFFLSVLCKP